MQSSKIQWTGFTVNPIRARNLETGAVGHYCEHAGPECMNCYAEAWNSRSRPTKTGGLLGTSLPYRPSSLPGLRLFLDEDVLDTVRRREKPARVFWCSMTDVAAHFVPDAFLSAIFDLIATKPGLTHQVLTKRPGRLAAFLAARGPLPASVWVGATVGVQARAAGSLGPLIGIDAAVRFVSVEPLLEPLDLTPWLPSLHWVIIGAESGHPARPMQLGWVRSLMGQCRDAGVRVFVKQLGKRPVDERDGRRVALKMADNAGADPGEWPEELRVREWPGDLRNCCAS